MAVGSSHPLDPGPFALRRRSFLGGSLAGAGALGLGLSLGPAQQARAAGGEEHLGMPITGVTAAGVGFTTNDAGRVMAVLIAGGDPSVFSAVDAITGELITSKVLSAVKQAWVYKTAPDRSVYIGTQAWGKLLRFDPDALTVTEVSSEPMFGQGHLWSLSITDDGQVFGGTYPDGKLLQYDPDGDEWIDHGQLVPGAQYVRSLTTDGTVLYAGTGTVPRIVRFDPGSGESSEIELPEDMQDEAFVYDLDLAGDLLFVRMTDSNTRLVHDLVSHEWVDRIPDGVGMHASGENVLVTDQGRRRVAYHSVKGKPVMAYDLDTHEQYETTLDLGGAGNRDWSTYRLRLAGFPQESLLTGLSDGRVMAFNPITHQTREITTEAEGSPYVIRSLATGPSGEIFVGGYLTPRALGVVDPETGEATQLPWSPQVEGMTAQGDDMVFGTYPNAGIHRFDTTKPWEVGTNPAPPIHIEESQDRPVALTVAGDRVAIGTVPGYGQLGGALTLLDGDGGLEVHRHVVQDQSVVTLLHRDGIIYGGSAIWGGLGIEPSATDGELFAFDLATEKVLWSVVPVPGETSIGALAFDDDGTLWGLGTNTLFSFDVAGQQVTRSETFFDSDNDATYVTGHELFWHEGQLVGTTAATVFTVDPSSWELTVLSEDKTNLAIDRLGNWYYSKGADLYRWTS